MRRPSYRWMLILMYFVLLSAYFVSSILYSRVVTVMNETSAITNRKCVIVDAGHGGIDGGATSCTGVLESQLNLQIAQRVNDLLHLLGVHTRMIRNDDISIYTTGETIAAQKISDLKERVRIVNETENAILLSLHMNYFSESQYHGPQVFYSAMDESKMLAECMQTALNSCAKPLSNRNTKKARGIYLLDRIVKPGVLIECGFISNPAEEAVLCNEEYQKVLTCTIVATLASYMHRT